MRGGSLENSARRKPSQSPVNMDKIHDQRLAHILDNPQKQEAKLTIYSFQPNLINASKRNKDLDKVKEIIRKKKRLMPLQIIKDNLP